MRLKFTKMQGAGNDFVVLDATRAPIVLDAAQWRWLADRRFGVGADQILIVGRPDDAARADFSYRIFNADGGEVEQCGNGARAFARFVRDNGLSDARSIRVETMSGVITPTVEADGTVSVDMGAPRFGLDDVPFDARGLVGRRVGDETLYALDVSNLGDGRSFEFGVLSMGNPHAVTLVDDVATAPVESVGPRIEHHPRFPRRVNVGFLERIDRGSVRLRVFERGGRLVIGWAGGSAPVTMRGPAETVFAGEIDVPDVSVAAALPSTTPAATPAVTLEPQPS